jgi:hypothetical protein
MTLRIDRVDTEIEVTRQESEETSQLAGSSSIGFDDINSMRGRTALREKLRPIVMEILNDELMRIKRKVGAP